MGSQRAGHDLVTEQQQQRNGLWNYSYKGWDGAWRAIRKGYKIVVIK